MTDSWQRLSLENPATKTIWLHQERNLFSLFTCHWHCWVRGPSWSSEGHLWARPGRRGRRRPEASRRLIATWWCGAGYLETTHSVTWTLESWQLYSGPLVDRLHPMHYCLYITCKMYITSVTTPARQKKVCKIIFSLSRFFGFVHLLSIDKTTRGTSFKKTISRISGD